MTRNFDDFIAGEDGVHVSTDDNALLVWGEGEGSSASVIGFSYNSTTPFDGIHNESKLLALYYLAFHNDVPLIWINSSKIGDGELELGIVEQQAEDTLQLNGGWIDLGDAPEQIQTFLNTNYESEGTTKQKNKRTAGGFHDWSRTNLPTELKKQNLDIVVTSDGVDTKYIVELKRSYIGLDDWTPYREDLRNYVLQVSASKTVDAVPLIVYQNKENITSDSLVTLFRINDIRPDRSVNWIDVDRIDQVEAGTVKTSFLDGNLPFDDG